MKVLVVTSTELGWDNVVGVYDSEKFTEEQLRRAFPSEVYVIQEHLVEVNTKGYEE